MKTQLKKSAYLFVLSVVLFASFTSCKEDEDPVVVQQKSIVETASSNSDFSILVQALQKADLVTTINNSTNLTVFAPTNSAFNALFTKLGVTGINDLSKETLTPILLYHVLGQKITSSQIQNGYVYTLSPGAGAKTQALYIKIDGGVKLNKTSKVVIPDIMTSNGIIHAIDQVILPNTVVDIASNNGDFSILVEAVVKADLAGTLSGAGPFTVFAPTNAAFQALFTTLGVTGIKDLTKEQLTPILLYHVVSGNVLSSQLQSGDVSTLNGKFKVAVGTQVTINDNVKVVAVDVQGSNGAVHVIDKVLLPK